MARRKKDNVFPPLTLKLLRWKRNWQTEIGPKIEALFHSPTSLPKISISHQIEDSSLSKAATTGAVPTRISCSIPKWGLSSSIHLMRNCQRKLMGWVPFCKKLTITWCSTVGKGRRTAKGKYKGNGSDKKTGREISKGRGKETDKLRDSGNSRLKYSEKWSFRRIRKGRRNHPSQEIPARPQSSEERKR